jgi:hypothetical protein
MEWISMNLLKFDFKNSWQDRDIAKYALFGIPVVLVDHIVAYVVYVLAGFFLIWMSHIDATLEE